MIDTINAMKIILVSGDTDLIKMAEDPEVIRGNQLVVYNESKDPLDVMSYICTEKSSLVMIDDDFLSPYTPHILRSIRKVLHNISIIFISSSNSIELGREISRIGIQFYALKPIDQNELKDLLESFNDLVNKKSYYKP